MKAPNDVLIVLVKDKRDFLIAQTEHWYRIPTRTRTPTNLRDGAARYIAFYFPKAFGPDKYRIRYYAEITQIDVVARNVLFPDEATNPKSGRTYHCIRFGPLRELPRPIISHRGRNLLFIPTTWAKFSRATEINDVFNDSPLEEALWLELKRHNLPAERQFLLRTNEQNWICDFVLFCKTGVINVECDGDTYHMKPEQVIYDKHRNNQISAVANWAPLRFTTKHLLDDMPQTIQTIKRKIDKLGGIQLVNEDEVTYRYVSKPDGQLGLFD